MVAQPLERAQGSPCSTYLGPERRQSTTDLVSRVKSSRVRNVLQHSPGWHGPDWTLQEIYKTDACKLAMREWTCSQSGDRDCLSTDSKSPLQFSSDFCIHSANALHEEQASIACIWQIIAAIKLDLSYVKRLLHSRQYLLTGMPKAAARCSK